MRVVRLPANCSDGFKNRHIVLNLIHGLGMVDGPGHGRGPAQTVKVSPWALYLHSRSQSKNALFMRYSNNKKEMNRLWILSGAIGGHKSY